MSISYEEDSTKQGAVGVIKMDNGDLDALNEVMDQYYFIDQQALLRYALVALLSSNDNKLYIKRDDDMVSLSVADKLIKSKNAMAG